LDEGRWPAVFLVRRLWGKDPIRVLQIPLISGPAKAASPAMILPDQAVILLVDDREDDIILITHALAKAEVHNPIFAVRSGNEAVAYLHGTGKYQNRDAYPLPDIMLLDLKMPGIDGFEVIRE